MKRWIAALLSSAILISAVTGCSDAEEAEVVLTAVETTKIVNSSIKKELTYAGKVQPIETVNVTSKISGQVDRIFFDMGDTVQAGEVLFTLDETDLRNQIKQLEAQLNVSNASVTSAQTSLEHVNGGQTETSRLQMQTGADNAEIAVNNARITVENAKISMENVKATLEDVEKKYNDTKTLYDAGVVSKSDFDSAELGYTQTLNSYQSAQNAYQTAQNAYETAVKSYNQAKESLEIFDNKITDENETAAQNGVNTAIAGRQSVETQLQIARETLEDTAVKAPISGVITNKNISSTNMISAASAPFTIVDMSKVTVDVKVSEKLINNIRQGQEVDVVISTLSNDIIKGKIKNISPATDNTSTYPVKIEIDNKDGKIKPGMFAEIRFVLGESNNTVVVARNTVMEGDDGAYVYILEGSTVRKIAVTTGIDNGESIEITSGLKEGDEVVTTGQTYVEDGDEVRVINSNGSPTNDEEAKTDDKETSAKEE